MDGKTRGRHREYILVERRESHKAQMLSRLKDHMGMNMRTAVVLLVVLVVAAYARDYLRSPAEPMTILQVSVSNPRLFETLLERSPIVLQEPLAEPLDAFAAKIFRWAHVYRRHRTVPEQDEASLRAHITLWRSTARWTLFQKKTTFHAPAADIEIAHPAQPRNAVRVALANDQVIVLPPMFLFRISAHGLHAPAAQASRKEAKASLLEVHDATSALLSPFVPARVRTRTLQKNVRLVHDPSGRS